MQARHSALVRITHWLTTISFLALLVSGIAILLAHPRLYWGETGAVGTPSLIDLPLPFVLTGQTGWGRYLHFLSGWVCVATGALYVSSGLITEHFRQHLLPARSDLAWSSLSRVVSNHVYLRRPPEEENRLPTTGCRRPEVTGVGSRQSGAEPLTYNVLQRLAYLAVVFALFPLMIWSGLAMSPAVTSVVPAFVDVLGGQQSARTIHFLAAVVLLAFLLVHVGMVCLTGFTVRMRAMVTGQSPSGAARI